VQEVFETNPTNRSLRNMLARLARLDVLVVDDWATAPSQETERRNLGAQLGEDLGSKTR
jgi:hypothetical protein